MSDDFNPFEESDFEWALERRRRRQEMERGERIREQGENDTAVALQNEAARKEAAKKRVQLWRDVTPPAETMWDRIREGRSAT